jgi:hypothetical protein
MNALAALFGRQREGFAAELHDLLEKYRFNPTIALEELVDAMENEVEVLVEEVNERAA